jgi:COP9 signalosome complex subunit 2
MTRLVQAFQKKDIVEFEKILAENQDCIMGDPFIKSHIDQVLINIRSQVLLKLVRPYTRIELGFISQKLNISILQVEDLLFSLILDKRVLGRIDQISNILELGSGG